MTKAHISNLSSISETHGQASLQEQIENPFECCPKSDWFAARVSNDVYRVAETHRICCHCPVVVFHIP